MPLRRLLTLWSLLTLRGLLTGWSPRLGGPRGWAEHPLLLLRITARRRPPILPAGYRRLSRRCGPGGGLGRSGGSGSSPGDHLGPELVKDGRIEPLLQPEQKGGVDASDPEAVRYKTA